jgi:hypothetical protein
MYSIQSTNKENYNLFESRSIFYINYDVIFFSAEFYYHV